jgi:predicted nucleic acid-binding protein
MSVFADTSALYPLLVENEPAHRQSREEFQRLLQARRPIWTTSFVLIETMALLQHRFGLAAARDFDESVVPVLRVQWVEAELYRQGIERLWREDRPHLSLVDCVGFEFMAQQGIVTAFAVDPHFEDAGFERIPLPAKRGPA